jgi:hypothetical protein
MKLFALATATLIGALSLAPAAMAQTEGFAVQSRTPQVDSAVVASSRTMDRAPVLEGVRPPAGMFPQASGPSRGVTGGASNDPAMGGDIRGRLRRE